MENPTSVDQSSIAELGRRAKLAARRVALATTDAKNAALLAAADLLVAATDDILAANANDLARAEASGATATQLDRLRLDATKIEGMAAGLRQVSSLPDPVGEVTEG